VHTGSQYGESLKALLFAAAISTPFLALGGWWMRTVQQEKADLAAQQREFAEAHERLQAAVPLEQVAVNDAIHGREWFMTTCAACHGSQGRGLEGLSRDLTISAFVAQQSDSQLAQFIIDGRPMAEPMPMPPKAGRDDMTDADIRDIVAYVRGLQDPRRMPELPAYTVTVAAVTEADKQAAMDAAGGDAELAQYIASGNKLFHTTCVACHGKEGVGVAGNGKALANNAFVQSLDDDGLLAFIQQGRAPSDPKNTTGIQMPPKGGNPAMTEDDLLDVITYLRTLQPAGSARAGKP